MECSGTERDVPWLHEISKKGWENLTLSCPWLQDPGIQHSQQGEVQPWVICLQSRRTHFTELGTGHTSPEQQAYMLTPGQPFQNTLHHAKNMNPYCTLGNKEVDHNVPCFPSIRRSFNGPIRTPKVYNFFMLLARVNPLWGTPVGLFHFPIP